MYNVALVGNPNVGKTTIYNALTGENAKTGNWQGVTVDVKQSKIKNTDFTLVDLPGIYSLDTFSLEEKVAEEYIEGHKESIFLNIVESANLERGINLTLSLLKKGLKVILVLTMFDEFIKYKGKIDVEKLSKLLKIPVIAINGQKRKDIKRLKELILASKNVKKVNNVDIEIPKLVQEIGYNTVKRSDVSDKILLNGYFTIISFILVVFAVFSMTFAKNSLGDILASKMNYLITDLLANSVKNWLAKTTCPIWIIGLFVEGVIQGIGSVLCFLPQLIILYTCITVLEESGYMARVAFMTDGLFKKIGLNGRAVFSILMGFGCTAMAVLSTKSLENKTLQKKAILSLPFISCSARLPIYLVIINSIFFKNKVLILMLIYFLGLILTILSAYFLNKIFFFSEETFLMEMPPLRLIPLKKLLKSLIYYTKQFIIRIGTIILILVVVLWFLTNFSKTFTYLNGQSVDKSLLASLGGVLKYFFYPMGIYDWEVAVSVIAGIFAKEAVAGTLNLLYPTGIALSTSSGLAFLVFCMLYTPCVATLVAMRRQIGLKLTLYSATFQMLIALVMGYLTYAMCLISVKINVWVILCLIVILCIIPFVKLKCHNCNGCKNEGICRKKARKNIKTFRERI